MRGWFTPRLTQIYVYVLGEEDQLPRYENPAPLQRTHVESLCRVVERTGRFVVAAGPEPGLVIEIARRFDVFDVRVTLFQSEWSTFVARSLPKREEVESLWPARAVRCPSCEMWVSVPIQATGEVALDAMGEVTRCSRCGFLTITSGVGKKANVSTRASRARCSPFPEAPATVARATRR